MPELLAGVLLFTKSMTFLTCVQRAISYTERMSHVILKAEKNDVQVLLLPNNEYRIGIHCRNGQIKVYRKNLK